MTQTGQKIALALLAPMAATPRPASLRRASGWPITRSMVEQRVHGSRVLAAVRQIAEQQALDRVLTGATTRKELAPASKASWPSGSARCKPAGSTPPRDPNDLDILTPPTRACARARQGYYAGCWQAERDRLLCCARTRKGLPCGAARAGQKPLRVSGGKSTVRRPKPGRPASPPPACPWERYRQERSHVGAVLSVLGANRTCCARYETYRF